MKISTRDLTSFIQSPPRHVRVALFYGADEGMVRELAQTLQAALLGPKADPMSITELSGDQLSSDPAALSDALTSLSLLGDSKLVVLRAPNAATPKIVQEFYAENTLGDVHFLIIMADELASSSSLRKWAENEDFTAALGCYPDEGPQLEGFLRAALQEKSIRATPEVVRYLASQWGGNRKVTRQEIEKIDLYLGKEQRELSLQLATDLAGENKELSMQDVSNALAGADSTALLHHLHKHFKDGEAPVAIARTALKYFQKLQNIAAEVSAGTPLDAAVAATRPFYKQAPHTKRHASMWNGVAVAAALSDLHALELGLKQSPRNAEQLCEESLLAIALKAQGLKRAA